MKEVSNIEAELKKSVAYKKKACTPATKLPKTQQKPLCITSAMAAAYLDILAMAMIWFFNS